MKNVLVFVRELLCVCGSQLVLTCEDDGILGGGAPGLHEMDCITAAEGGVTGEHNTRRLVNGAQFSMDVGKMLQTTTLDKLVVVCGGGGGGGGGEGGT